MTENTEPGTTDVEPSTEPSTPPDETEMLLFALHRSRRHFAWKTGGLDAGGLAKPHPPSAMTLGGLVKHLALVEDHYRTKALTGEPMNPPWDAVDFDADPEWEWRTGAQDPPEELYALWGGAVDRMETAIALALETGGPDQPIRLTNGDGEPFSLRRLLVDLHDEYARHVGHADLLREAVDGLTGEDPPRP